MSDDITNLHYVIQLLEANNHWHTAEVLRKILTDILEGK